MADEAEPSYAQHQRMRNAQPCPQIWMWSRLFTQRWGAKTLHECFFALDHPLQLPAHCRTDRATMPKSGGLHVSISSQLSTPIPDTWPETKLALRIMIKPCGIPLTAPHLLAWPPIATECLKEYCKQWRRTSHMLSARWFAMAGTAPEQ
jgi:hypothetical protein